MLAPPPEPVSLSPLAAVSFQPCSGIHSSAEERVSAPPVGPLQYGESAPAVLSPKNSFPPAPVTSGIEAGASTSRPVVADVLPWGSQSAAPRSPDAETIVCPCVWPCCAQVWSVPPGCTKLAGSPDSQNP